MIAKPTLLFVAALTVAQAMAQTAAVPEKKVLRLNLAAGNSITMKTVTDGVMNLSVQGNDNEMKSKITMVNKTDVSAGDGTWLKFILQTTDFKMEGDTMDMGMGGGTDPATAMKAVKIQGEFDPTGTTRNVTIADDDKLDMMTKQSMSSMLEQWSQIGFMALTFPKDAVGVGDKWTKELDLGKVMGSNPMISNAAGKAPMEFTIEAFEKVDAMDTVKIKVFMDAKATFDIAAAGSSGSMTMTSNGFVWVDLATGVTVKGESKMANNIDFGVGSMQQNMTIAQSATVSK
ncbi:MAG: hypothetical protein JST30_09865 [Armatimonadetes bacterium]|nr:hypothetical protein [Armatimonadota bacterium]